MIFFNTKQKDKTYILFKKEKKKKTEATAIKIKLNSLNSNSIQSDQPRAGLKGAGPQKAVEPRETGKGAAPPGGGLGVAGHL